MTSVHSPGGYPETLDNPVWPNMAFASHKSCIGTSLRRIKQESKKSTFPIGYHSVHDLQPFSQSRNEDVIIGLLPVVEDNKSVLKDGPFYVFAFKSPLGHVDTHCG